MLVRPSDGRNKLTFPNTENEPVGRKMNSLKLEFYNGRARCGLGLFGGAFGLPLIRTRKREKVRFYF